MAGATTLEEVLSSCLSPENLRRTQAEAALKVSDVFAQLAVPNACPATRSCCIALCMPWRGFSMARGSPFPVHLPVRSKASISWDCLRHAEGCSGVAGSSSKSAEVLPHLVATVQQSQSPEVQLLAAQTLRKHIPRFWRRLSQQVLHQHAAWRPC